MSLASELGAKGGIGGRTWWDTFTEEFDHGGASEEEAGGVHGC